METSSPATLVEDSSGPCPSASLDDRDDMPTPILTDHVGSYVAEPHPSGCPQMLRLYVETRRGSLTSKEYAFLQEACDQGDGETIQKIHMKLRDRNIFPDVDFTEEAFSDFPSLTSVASDSRVYIDARQKLVTQRKSDCMIGKLWAAHQSGISVSAESSRRSLVSRAASISSLSSPGASSLLLTQSHVDQRDGSENAPDKSRSRVRLGTSKGAASLLNETESRIFSPRSNFRRIGRKIIVSGRTIKTIASTRQSLPPKPAPRKRSLVSLETDTAFSPFRASTPSPMRVSFVGLPESNEGEVNDAVSFQHTRDEKKDDDGATDGTGINEKPPQRYLMIREASASNYGGIGVEVEQEPDSESKGKEKPPALRRPVLMRMASVSVYHGEGIEVADWEEAATPKERDVSHQTESRMESLVATDDASDSDTDEIRCLSFDETMSYERSYSNFTKPSLRRNLSDSDLTENRDSETWSLFEADEEHFDTWGVLDSSEYISSHHLDFFILGTSANDCKAQPHVMSPPLMESLQEYLPFSKRGESFWLKYSLVRDGASLRTFLQHARGATYSLLAIETLDGEVFGAFTTQPWRLSWNWNTLGGKESFLWKMRHSRRVKCHSIIDQAEKESEVAVFPYIYANDNIQLCTNNRIAIGGGTPNLNDEVPNVLKGTKPHAWGFGISLSSDLMEGTTSPCITFGSPSLSSYHSDGSLFQVMNIELWTFTPCITVEDAERLELRNLFFESHRSEL